MLCVHITSDVHFILSDLSFELDVSRIRVVAEMDPMKLGKVDRKQKRELKFDGDIIREKSSGI